MSEDNPSIMSHVSIGTNNLDVSIAFYDKVLAVLGCKQLHAFPGAVAYGKQFPEFWVHKAIDGKEATVGNGTHFGFIAPNQKAVDEFHRVALEAGATCDGPPGPRPLYGEPYYGAFVTDPDGHKIEAAHWDESLM
ncbi:MAG: VOC family protein [Myxococcota bacterium]